MQKNKGKDLYNSLDANATTAGECKMPPITLADFTSQNEILLSELAYDNNTTLQAVADEHYAIYLESIKDRDYD